MYELESGLPARESRRSRPRAPVWPYTAAATAMLAAAGTFGAAMLFRWWWPLAAALLLGAILTFYLYQDERSAGVVVYGATCPVAAGSWLAWGYSHSLVSAGSASSWLALVLGAAVLGSAGWVVLALEQRANYRTKVHQVAVQAAAQAALAASPQAVAERREQETCARWQQRFQDVSNRKLNVNLYALRLWAGESAEYGYNLFGQLPGKGATLKLVQGLQDELEVDAHVSGETVYGVEIRPGANKSLFVASIATGDAMAREWPFPLKEMAAGGPRTIADGVTLGRHPDGTIPTIYLRSATPLVSGRKGGGKSNLMHACVGGLCWCVDTINIVIDISKRGSFGAPWARPFIMGEASAPGVDWIASTWEEAVVLTGFFLHLLQQRQVAYSELKFQVNDDKLPVAPGRPKIVIWVDEFAEIGGATNKPKKPEVAQNLLQIIRTGREMAIDVAICGLRVTSETVPQEVTVQASIKLATRMESAAEMAQVFGWERPLSQEDIPYPGCAYWAQDDGSSVGSVPRRLRSWRMAPATITEIVKETARYRSPLDVEICSPAWREQYEGRWDRTVPVVFPGLAESWAARRRVDRVDTPARPTVHLSTPVAAPLATVVSTRGVDTPERVEAGQVDTGGSAGRPAPEPALAMAQGMARIESSLARARELLAEQQGPGDLDQQFRETVVAGGAVAPENPWGQTQPPSDAAEQGRRTLAETREAQGVMLRVLYDAGPSGCSFDHVSDEMDRLGRPTPKSTLYRWLTPYSSGFERFVSPDFAI